MSECNEGLGGTVECPEANIGESGELNGQVYTKQDGHVHQKSIESEGANSSLITLDQSVG